MGHPLTHPLTDQHLADLALARSASQGEIRARRELATRLLRRVQTSVRYLVGGHDGDADDLVQSAMLEILKHLDTFEGRASLDTWADRITVRTTLRALKRRQSRWQRLTSWAQSTSRSEPQDPCADARVGELRRRLALAMGRLPLEQRVVVMLRWVYEYSMPDIAHVTDAPLDTVRYRFKVGRAKLRSHAKKDPLLRAWADAGGLS